MIEIDTSDTAVPERPEAKIKIGRKMYVVRAPKTDVWRETTELLAKVDLAKELAQDSDLPPEDEVQRDLIAQELSDVAALEVALITGREIRDDNGELVRIDGGFLRRTMTSPQDWDELYRDWHSDDSDVSLEYLFTIVGKIREHFAPWYHQRENFTGLPEVTKPKRASKTAAAGRARTAKAK